MLHADHPAASSDRSSRFTALAILTAALWLPVVGTAGAQPVGRQRADGGWFAGSAVVLWAAAGTPEDPKGPGYLSPYFHGAVRWPAIGGHVTVGRLLDRNWSLAAELSAHWPASVSVSEDSSGHTDRTSLTSRYREQQALLSLVAGWRPGAPRAVTFQPVLGLTISRTSQSLADRTGEYSWYGGTLPVSRPDASFSTVRLGVVIGADVQRQWKSRLSLTAIVRAHWVRRPENASPYRDAPAMAPVVLYAGAGARWGR